jgi:hypothetical protein
VFRFTGTLIQSVLIFCFFQEHLSILFRFCIVFRKHSYIVSETFIHFTRTLVQKCFDFSFFYFLLFTYFIFAVLRTRGRGGRIVWFECENFIQCQTKEQAVEQQQQLVQDQWGWWLFDRSILTRYEDHVAHRLWFGRLSD